MATSLPIDYDKRLMLFSGRANPELAARIADKLGVDLGPVTLKTFSNGEVYCRYEESIRGADVFIVQPTCANPELGLSANDALMELLLMIDAAVGRLRAPRDRRDAVVRLQPPGQEVGAARADLGAPGRADDRVGRRGPRADDGPPRRPDPGLLPQAGRPHDRAVHAHAVLRRPRPHRPRRRRARRRPRQAQQEVRLQARRRAGHPRQGAPGPAGGGDRLRHRRREGQDRRDRRRHDRHRRHAARRRPDGARRGRVARLRRRHAPGPQRQRLREPRRFGLRADRRHRHDPAALRRARQPARALLRGAADRLDPPHLHRRLGVTRSSAARTSCSESPAR